MYIPSSGIFSAGTSHEWVINNLFSDFGDEEKYQKFDKLAMQAPIGANGVFFCPVFSGGAYVDASTEMKGGFVNIDLNTTRESIARATYEGIAFELKLCLDAISSIANISDDLLFVGGGATSDFWRSIYANIFEKNILKSDISRGIASIGAASLALVGIGAWEGFDQLNNINLSEKTEYKKSNSEKYKKLYPIFKKVCQAYAEIYKNIKETL